MDYDSAIEWLYGTQLFGINLGLENMRRVCGELDLPARGGSLVHVAGTNGKGSVCAFTDAVCRAGGHRTGLFTSPHLVSYRERIAVDGEWISEADAAAGLTELRSAVEGWDPHPTFFELSTALALRQFAKREVEVTVLETGMGGRLDATTAAAGLHLEHGGSGVSVITPIGLDHREWLGESLVEIAGEKAGIILPGVKVVSAPQEVEVEKVLREAVKAANSPIRFVGSEWEKGPVGLMGAHQRRNAGLAAAAIEDAEIAVSEEAILRGIADVRWRGRFERIRIGEGGEIVLDAAHNPEAAGALADTWRENFGSSKATVIFGAVAWKDYLEVLRRLEPIAERFVFCPVNSVRGLPPGELAKASGHADDGEVAANVAEALAIAGKGSPSLILVTGSLFLVGEALAELGAGDFERSAQ